ncbi:hypothetical protein HKX48_001143, partial [Thoreauomyces humboldtii]
FHHMASHEPLPSLPDQIPTDASFSSGDEGDDDDETPLATLTRAAKSYESLRSASDRSSLTLCEEPFNNDPRRSIAAPGGTYIPRSNRMSVPMVHVPRPVSVAPPAQDYQTSESPLDEVHAPAASDAAEHAFPITEEQEREQEREQEDQDEDQDDEESSDDQTNILTAEIRNAFLSGRMREDDHSDDFVPHTRSSSAAPSLAASDTPTVREARIIHPNRSVASLVRSNRSIASLGSVHSVQRREPSEQGAESSSLSSIGPADVATNPEQPAGDEPSDLLTPPPPPTSEPFPAESLPAVLPETTEALPKTAERVAPDHAFRPAEPAAAGPAAALHAEEEVATSEATTASELPKSPSSVSLPQTFQGQASVATPPALSLAHPNHSTPAVSAIPTSASRSAGVKPRGRVSSCFSWLPGFGKSRARKTQGPSTVPFAASATVHTLNPLPVRDMSSGKPAFPPVTASPSPEPVRLGIKRSTANLNERARSPSAPRTDDLGSPPDENAGSDTGSERRSIFRQNRNASRERTVSDQHSSAGSSRRGSASEAGASEHDAESEDESDAGSERSRDDKSEAMTLHSRISKMSLVLPEAPRLGDFDMDIPTAPARTEVPLSFSPHELDDLNKSNVSLARTATIASSPSTKEDLEDAENLEHLRLVVNSNTRHVKESAAAHRRRWDEELQGSHTGSHSEGDVHSKQSGSLSRPQSPGPVDADYDSMPSSASALYDSKMARARAMASQPATPSPEKRYLTQDFGLGMFDSLGSSGNQAVYRGSDRPNPSASSLVAAPPAESSTRSDVEKLYADIMGNMDLDQLAGRYDASARRRPTVHKDSSPIGSGVAGNFVADPLATPPQTPPQSANGSNASLTSQQQQQQQEQAPAVDSITGWRRNIARALESTTQARGGHHVITPPGSPDHHNHKQDGSQLPVVAPRARPHPMSRNQSAPARKNVWSLHEDFVTAVEGEDGEDLAGVVGYALAVGDGQL